MHCTVLNCHINDVSQLTEHTNQRELNHEGLNQTSRIVPSVFSRQKKHSRRSVKAAGRDVNLTIAVARECKKLLIAAYS